MAFQSILSNQSEANYKLYPELREFLCRMLNELKQNEVETTINYNQSNPNSPPQKSLFAKVLIEPEETNVNLGDIISKTQITANSETFTGDYHTLITLEIEKNNVYNQAIEQEMYSCDCKDISVACNIRLRTQRLLGRKSYIEQLVKYIKDNVTRNDFEYSSDLLKSENWLNHRLTSKCFLNWDPNNQLPDITIDPETSWYFYQFQIIFIIVIQKI